MSKQVCIVYMLTNTINGKYYIGQSVNSLEIRWTKHKHNAKAGLQKCRFLENAIKKNGHENFRREVLVYCSQEDLNDYEMKLISMYMSNDRTFGYNICEGGGGSVSRPVTDDHRNKISIANKKTELPINIQERRDSEGVLTGYVVAKNINNVRYNKNFASISKTLDENMQLAIQCLDQLNLGNFESVNVMYNRTNDLPRNISYNYNKNKVIIGYTFKHEKNGTRKIKTFTLKSLSMEVKLQMAIDFKAAYLEVLK